MLNDVRFPPVDPKPAVGSHSRPAPREDENSSRVRARLPHCDASDAPQAIYGEPEDRGEPFNTSMSVIVVGIVVFVVVGVFALSFVRHS